MPAEPVTYRGDHGCEYAACGGEGHHQRTPVVAGLDAPGWPVSRGTRPGLHVIELGKLGTQLLTQPLFLLRVRVRVQLYQQLSPLDTRLSPTARESRDLAFDTPAQA